MSYQRKPTFNYSHFIVLFHNKTQRLQDTAMAAVRIIVTSSIFVYSFGQSYANLPVT